MDRKSRSLIAAVLVLPALAVGPDDARAFDIGAKIKGLFSSGDIKPFSKRGTPADTVRQQTEEALTALTSLTFLNETDARQYARNPQGLLGFYAYVTPKNKLVLLGGSRKVTVQKIDLKNDVLFRGVVKQGYDAGIGIPVLQVNLKNQQVAELSVQDIVTVASDFTADQIACDFPYAWRDKANAAGATQFYYIPSATVSALSSRRFESSDQGLTGVFTILNIAGSRYYSDETLSTKYFVTVSLTPVSPLSAEVCERVTKRNVFLDGLQGLRAGFEMQSLDTALMTDAGVPQDKLTSDLAERTNPESLRGVSLDVVMERFPDAP